MSDTKIPPEYTEYLCHTHSHGEENRHQQTIEKPLKKRAPRVKEKSSSDEEENKNQKYDPNRACNTLYGDRLRKKLLAEEEEERKAKDEERRLKAEEERKQEAEKQQKKEEEEQKLKEEEEERKREVEKQKRRDEERRLKEKEKKYEEDRQRRKEEEIEKQRRRDEERRLKEEERKYEEEKQRRKDEERRNREEQLRKKEEEKRSKEEFQRKKEEERRKKDEDKRLRDEYQWKKDNEKRKKDQEKRVRDERKKEEERRYKEDQKKREEAQRKRDEERRRRDDERKAREEDQRIQDEERKLKDEKARLERMIREEDRQQRIAQQIADAAKTRTVELEEQRKKVLENKENQKQSKFSDVREPVETRTDQSMSSEEYAARLCRLNLKKDEHSNQRPNQDGELQERQRSDKDVPHDPRRAKKTETDVRRRRNGAAGSGSRSPENVRNKKFSGERSKNDFPRNKAQPDHSSRYLNHNENLRHGPHQSKVRKNDQCQNDWVQDLWRNGRDRNWPEERTDENRKRKCASPDRGMRHVLKKNKLEEENRNNLETQKSKAEVNESEIESPDELEDGEIPSMDTSDVDLYKKQSEELEDNTEDEESLEKIQQQLKEFNEMKAENQVTVELPKEKFTETQLKNVLESPKRTKKLPRKKSKTSRSQSRSQSRDREETKETENLEDKDVLKPEDTVEPMVQVEANSEPTKTAEEEVPVDLQKLPNTDLGAPSEEVEPEKITKTEESHCEKSDSQPMEIQTETEVNKENIEEEAKQEDDDEVSKLNDEIKPTNQELSVNPDNPAEPIFNQLTSLIAFTSVEAAPVEPEQSEVFKDVEALDLKLEISLSPAEKFSSDEKCDPPEEDKTTSNGTVESDSKDKTTTSDKTSSSSSSSTSDMSDQSPDLPKLNLSESSVEESLDNLKSETVPKTDVPEPVLDKVPEPETSKPVVEDKPKLEDKMYQLFGSSVEPPVMFSPIMEVEVETTKTVDSPRIKLNLDKEEEEEVQKMEVGEIINKPKLQEPKLNFQPMSQAEAILRRRGKVDFNECAKRILSGEKNPCIKLEPVDLPVRNKPGAVSEQPNSFAAFRRTKKVVVSVGKVKKANSKNGKIQHLLNRNEDKVRQAIEELVEEKKNPGTILKKNAVAKKVTVKTEKKGPIVFKRRRPKQLSDSSSCFTVE